MALEWTFWGDIYRGKWLPFVRRTVDSLSQHTGLLVHVPNESRVRTPFRSALISPLASLDSLACLLLCGLRLWAGFPLGGDTATAGLALVTTDSSIPEKGGVSPYKSQIIPRPCSHEPAGLDSLGSARH